MSRRYYRRRKPYRKRNYRRRSYGGLAKLKRDVKALQSNAELKYSDASGASTQAGSAAGAVNCVSLMTIAQGTGTNNREGDVLNLKRFMLRGYFVNDGTTPADVIVRIIVFRAKQSNNALMNNNLYLEHQTINSLRRMAHKTRFKTYFDQTFTMATPNNTDGVAPIIPIKIQFNMKSKAQFNGNANGGSYLDQEKNSLWMLVLGSNATVDNPHLYYNTRLTYYDS